MSTLFLRNGHLLWLTVAVLLVAGGSALVSLPRLEDPRITNRFPVIVTAYPGAGADRVEALVTEPIEEALEEVPEVKTVESTSRAGVSTVAVELEDAVTKATNKEVFGRIRDRLGAVRLPPDAGPPVFEDQRGAATWTLVVAVSGGGSVEEKDFADLNRLGRVAEDLADTLRGVPGTDLVRLYGEPNEEVTVTIDRGELAALGLTPADVAARLADADAKRPAGTVRGGGSERAVEVAGELDSVSRVRDVPLKMSADAGGTSSNAAVRVGDVATVARGFREPPRSLALADGRRAVFVAARVGDGKRVDRWAADARATLAEWTAATGFADPSAGTRVTVVYDESVYTDARLAELAGNLLGGAGVVLLVVLAVMGWRAALVVGSALPLVAGLTLFGLLLAGVGLHQMSIFGAIVALGLLIDNAIVVADETRTRLSVVPPGDVRGERAARERAVRGTLRHLAAPLAAGTLTTVLAFAPIVLLDGNIGDFVGPIGVSVVLAVAGSFAVALTVTAALAGKYLPVGDGADAKRPGCSAASGTPDPPEHAAELPTAAALSRERGRTLVPPVSRLSSLASRGFHSKRLARLYAAAVAAGVRRPWRALAVSLVLPACGAVAVTGMGRQFFPRVDRNMFDLQLWTPAGSSLEHTADLARSVEGVLRADDAVDRVHWLAGASLPAVYYNLTETADDRPDYARAVVFTRTAADVKPLLAAVQPVLDDRFPGAQVVLNQFAQGPPVDAPVVFRLYGPEVSVLQDLGEEVRRRLQSHPKVLHARTTLPRGRPRVWVDADEDAARLAGLSPGGVADRLRAELDGAVGGSVLEDLEELPVRVRVAPADRGDLRALADTNLPLSPRPDAPDGTANWLPLAALGTPTLRPESGGVTRKDGRRCNVIEGYVTNDALPIAVTADVLAELAADGFAPPPGYSLESGGDSEEEGEAVAKLARYLPVLLTLTAATLILAFRSVALAALLGAVGLLSVFLGLLATWACGFPLSFNTILGTLGLVGVALNDSIVVLAALRDSADSRAGDADAVAREVRGCTRHVLATTLTTAGGFLPLILSGGDFWPPLAVVIAGGVLGATLLALVFVPAGYVLLVRRRAAT